MSVLDVYRAAESASLAYLQDPSDYNLNRCFAFNAVVVDEVNLRSKVTRAEEFQIDSMLSQTERITLQLTGAYQRLMGLPEDTPHQHVHSTFFAGVFHRLTCISVHKKYADSVSLPPIGVSERFCLTSPIHSGAEAPLVPPFEVRFVESVARALEAFCQSQETIYRTGSRQPTDLVPEVTYGELDLRNLYATVHKVLDAYYEANPRPRVTLENLSFAPGTDPNITRIDAREIFVDDRPHVQERALAGAGLLSWAYRQTAVARDWRPRPAHISITRDDFRHIYESAEKLRSLGSSMIRPGVRNTIEELILYSSPLVFLPSRDCFLSEHSFFPL